MKRLARCFASCLALLAFFSYQAYAAGPCHCRGSAYIEITAVPYIYASYLLGGRLVSETVAQTQGWTVAIHSCTCDQVNAQGYKDCRTHYESYIWNILRPWPPAGEYWVPDEEHGCTWHNIDGTMMCSNEGCQ